MIAKLSDTPTHKELINAVNELIELTSVIPNLSTVATSGSYRDLHDLPTKLSDIRDYSQGE